jgi:Zn ribbon nucleic-acid-binding protein
MIKDHLISYKVCPACDTQKHIDAFRKKGTKLRNCCNVCVDRHSPEELNIILQPRKIFDGQLEPTDSGNVYMRFKHSKITPIEISYEIGMEYLAEGAAVIKSKHTIVRLFDDKSLRNHVLKRDRNVCFNCGGLATSVQRIMSKVEGGLKTPLNMKSICTKCVGHTTFKSKQHGPSLNILYKSEVIKVFPQPEFIIDLDPSIVHIYCDASELGLCAGKYGVAIVIVNNYVVEILTNTFEYAAHQSHYAELEAIQFAMMNAPYETKINIYTDVPIKNYKKNTGLMGNIVRRIIGKKTEHTKVITMSNQDQKNIYYRLAHQFSRIAVKSAYIIRNRSMI